MSDWFLARAGEVYGPYPISQLIEMHHGEELLPADFFCLSGQESWLPHQAFVAEQCELSQPSKTHAPVTSTRNNARQQQQPTAKQQAFLEFMGFPVPETKEQASMLVDAAYNNQMLSDRLQEWTHARLKLHPELYADEAKKSAGLATEARALRAKAFRDAINDEAANEPDACAFKKISLQEAQAVIDYLDSLGEWDRGQWGEQRSMSDYALRDQFLDRALVLRFPDKLKKSWRWKFEL